MYRLPKPLTEDAVRALMKDPRYQDRGHPEHRGFTDFVTSAFRSLYPEPEKKFIRIGACTAEPDTIISDDTPTWMRERGMMLSAGTDDGGTSARTPKLAAPKLPPRPGMLTDPPPPRLISPVPDATIRPKDDWARKGSGFWAERKSGDELRPHKGIDQVAAPGTRVIAPVGGKMTRFRVYSDERKAEMMGIRIKADDGHEVDTFYVDVDPKLENESRVEPGDVIGKVQDVSGLYRRLNPNIGPMTNHVHLQVKNPKGEYVDPTSYVTGWALSQGHPERRNK